MNFAELFEGAGGTYVAARFCEKSVRALADLQKQIGVPNPLSPENFHTTIVYSRVAIDWEPVVHDVPAEAVGFRIFENNGSNCLVLEIKCDQLTERFHEAMAKGATFDFPTYIPHVTLSDDVGDFIADELEPHALRLTVAHEFIDEIR